jgi:hypothetical protein
MKLPSVDDDVEEKRMVDGDNITVSFSGLEFIMEQLKLLGVLDNVNVTS